MLSPMFLFTCLFHPIYYLRPSFAHFFLVLTHLRGHIAGSSCPLRATVLALHFYHEKSPAFSSLVVSRRIVPTHARRSQQLILFLFLQINSKSHHGGIRTHGPTVFIAAFIRGLLLDHCRPRNMTNSTISEFFVFKKRPKNSGEKKNKIQKYKSTRIKLISWGGSYFLCQDIHANIHTHMVWWCVFFN